MPSIFDFSSAAPWLVAGFLAGLFVFWLVRALLGIDRRRMAELTTAYTALDDVRGYAAQSDAKLSKLEAERARLAADLEQASPRAALVPQFERQLAELQQTSAGRQNQLAAAEQALAALRETSAAEIAALRHEAENQSGTAKYYEGEFNRLFADYEQSGKQASSVVDELARTKAALEATAKGASDAERLKAELATAKANLEAAAREASEAVRLRSELSSAKANLESTSADSSELVRLRAELTSTKSGLEAQRAELEKIRAADGANVDRMAKLTADYEAKLKSAIAEIGMRSDEARKNGEEVARLKAELSAVQAAAPKDNGADLARLQAEISKLSNDLTAASVARNALQSEYQQARKSLEDSSILAASRYDEIERLKAQVAAAPAELENYRRFKEALDAANRIAAGLPEKG